MGEPVKELALPGQPVQSAHPTITAGPNGRADI